MSFKYQKFTATNFFIAQTYYFNFIAIPRINYCNDFDVIGTIFPLS